MQETELKVLLTEEQYVVLCKKFKCNKVVNQINFYYSDELNIIRNQGITVRVRGKDNRARLEIKVPCGEQGLVHRKNEYAKDLEAIPLNIDRKTIKEIADIEVPRVAMKGYLITERKMVNWDNETEICLDRNQYLSVTDYELEVEYNDRIPDRVLDILKSERIPLVKTNGKCNRFFEQLERRENGESK